MRLESTILLLVFGLWDADAHAQGNLFTFDADGTQNQFGAAVAGAGDVDHDGIDDVLVGVPEAWEILFVTSSGHANVYSGADGSKLYTFSGAAAGDRFGVAVDAAGDVNSDGHADIVIGADQGGNIFGGAGYVRVISGSDGALLRQLSGANAGDRFGRAVSHAGDVNNDGTPDVIVGAPFADVDGESSGTASVFSGADGSLLFSVDGNGPPSEQSVPVGDQLGYSVDGVGDVNSDGFDDVVVGSLSPFLFASGQGNYLHVVSGATGSVLFTFVGDSDIDAMGAAVAGAGDMDMDGTPDILAGAPYDSNVAFTSGSARAFSGEDGSVLQFFPGGSGFAFGTTVAGIGDANGDGADDVAIGAGSSSPNTDAVATVYSGADGVPLAAIAADGGEHGLRAIVGAAGDIDSDGLADVVIGFHSVLDDGFVEVDAPSMLASAPLPAFSFTPGDTLVGTIDDEEDVDDVNFSLVPDAKVWFHVSVTDGDLDPIVSLYSVSADQSEEKLKEWKAVGSKPLKFKSKKGGAYELRVRGAAGSTGSFEIETVAGLPDFAEGGVAVEKLHKVKVEGVKVFLAESTLPALAGSRLDATITPVTDFVPSSIVVLTPSDEAIAESLYSVVEMDGAILLHGVPMLETGLYRIRVFGGGKGDKVEFDLAPTPPPGAGLTIEIE